MQNLTLNKNQYEALRSLLAELDDIEDTGADGGATALWVSGNISRDNYDDLRDFCGLIKRT